MSSGKVYLFLADLHQRNEVNRQELNLTTLDPESAETGDLVTIHSYPSSACSESDEEAYPSPTVRPDSKPNPKTYSSLPVANPGAIESKHKSRVSYTVHRGRVINHNGDSISSISSDSPPKPELLQTTRAMKARAGRNDSGAYPASRGIKSHPNVKKMDSTSDGGVTYNKYGGSISPDINDRTVHHTSTTLGGG